MGEKSPRKNSESAPAGGVSRRSFLTTAGVGTVGLAVAGSTPAAVTPASEVLDAAEAARVSLKINGRVHRLLVEPRWSLLFVLRERLGLSGAKAGCERGECGACTVLLDDTPRYACMTLAVEAEGVEITTVEDLLDGEELGDVQRAFAEHDGFQCGYCTCGQVMAVEGLLRTNPSPSLEEIRVGVSGNLCRCGAYPNIFRAAASAAEKRARGGGA